MGWELFICFRIYNKITKECFEKIISDDKYKKVEWEMEVKIDKKYLNRLYYGNITCGTCDDPKQMCLYINNKHILTTTTNVNTIDNNNEKMIELKTGRNMILYEYNIARINFELNQDKYIFKAKRFDLCCHLSRYEYNNYFKIHKYFEYYENLKDLEK